MQMDLNLLQRISTTSEKIKLFVNSIKPFYELYME